MAEIPAVPEICGRIAQVRAELHGPRGKAAFAKVLGLSPSTYNYYEAARVPPADVLVRIADVAGADLGWLLTGQASATAVGGDHPAVQRIARILADHPQAAEPLTAFVEMLAATLDWPEKGAAMTEPDQAPAAASPTAGTPKGQAAVVPAQTPEGQAAVAPNDREDWIPILGRSAAGVPMFWDADDDTAGLTALTELVERHARSSASRVSSAAATDEAGADAGDAQIITLSAPDADNVAEFVVAGPLKRKCPDAFAVRIDGDSMAPDIRHGDLVICSASAPAVDGKTALVQLAGQIGVTCKIYRKTGKTVHLVPINDQYAPQTFGAEQVRWAKRLLARVRAR